MSVDFEGLAAQLAARSVSLLKEWLPAGKLRGKEYVVGDLNGEAGESLSINTESGLWKDFATGQAGGDLISLYAAINHCTQLEAATRLGGAPMPAVRPRKAVVIDQPALYAPADAPLPAKHYKHGTPTSLYPYRDGTGLLGYVARFDLPEGKQFAQYRWTSDGWALKSLPKPRPLYGLERLLQRPDTRVLVVEGEKCVDALTPVMAHHVVVCWSGGASAWDTADWSPLHGRNVDLWPDNDEPGRKAMAALAGKVIVPHCPQSRVISPEGMPDGWDGADAIASGMDLPALVQWIKREGGKYLTALSMGAASDGPATESGAGSSLSPAPGSEAAPASTLVNERQMWEDMGLETRTPNGQPHPNEDTVFRILEWKRKQSASDVFWYDTFLQSAMTSWGGCAPRPIEDADFTDVLITLQRDLRLPRMRLGTVKSGIEAFCFKHKRNVAQDWLKSLEWDGAARLDKMLPEAFGTEDNDYHRQVGKNFIMSIVARVLDPGCQQDHVPIFEGEQGTRKSSMLRVIGGDWFAEVTADMKDKDFLQNMRGKMLLEIGELAAMSKHEQEKVKQVITNRSDTYRASYGRMSGTYDRQCTFAGTTNRNDWVRDETGARRYWRVITGELKPDWVLERRDQIFAEAVHRYNSGECYWEVPQDEARRLTDDARETDPWDSAVIGYAESRLYVRIEDIMSDVLSMPLDRHDNQSAKRIRSILKGAGYILQQQWDGISKRNLKVYRRRRVPAAMLSQDYDSL